MTGVQAISADNPSQSQGIISDGAAFPRRSLEADNAMCIFANGTPVAIASEQPHAYTIQEEKRVLRKIDIHVLLPLCLLYFSQQACKSALIWSSAFDLLPATHLQGSQYSWLSSLLYIAQLVFQPLSSFVLIRSPAKFWVIINLFGWSAVTTASAAATSFAGLATTSFLLGIFQSTIANSCVMITQTYWRRREQSYRTTYWQISNSAAGVIGPLLTYAVAQPAMKPGGIHAYQAITICIGALGLAIVPVVAYLLPKSLETARFLESEGERHMAIMRLQDNQTGNQKTSKIRWSHIKDALRDPKTWGWSFMYFCCALPSGGLAAFGPIITRGFGYSPLNTILIQIPMSVNSIILLWTATWIMNKLKIRYPIIAFLTLLPIGGAIGLLKVPRERSGVLLCCYYFANTQGILNPLILSWGNLNAAGRTKMVITTSLGFAFACLGNIIGPQVYLSREKPYYRTGLYVDIGCWCCISMMCFVMARYLAHLNKVQEMKRVSTGQRGNSQDTSIMSLKEAAAYKANLRTTIIEENPQGEEANKMDDLTDNENVNFHYVL